MHLLTIVQETFWGDVPTPEEGYSSARGTRGEGNWIDDCDRYFVHSTESSLPPSSTHRHPRKRIWVRNMKKRHKKGKKNGKPNRITNMASATYTWRVLKTSRVLSKCIRIRTRYSYICAIHSHFRGAAYKNKIPPSIYTQYNRQAISK